MPSIHNTTACLFLWGLMFCISGCHENDSGISNNELHDETKQPDESQKILNSIDKSPSIIDITSLEQPKPTLEISSKDVNAILIDCLNTKKNYNWLTSSRCSRQMLHDRQL